MQRRTGQSEPTGDGHRFAGRRPVPRRPVDPARSRNALSGSSAETGRRHPQGNNERSDSQRQDPGSSENNPRRAGGAGSQDAAPDDDLAPPEPAGNTFTVHPDMSWPVALILTIKSELNRCRTVRQRDRLVRTVLGAVLIVVVLIVVAVVQVFGSLPWSVMPVAAVSLVAWSLSARWLRVRRRKPSPERERG